MNTSWLDYISFMQLTFQIKYKHISWITGFKSSEMQIRAVSLQHPNQAKHILHLQLRHVSHSAERGCLFPEMVSAY